ncbi:MAG: thermopsin family protease [Thermoplasmata archaeon]
MSPSPLGRRALWVLPIVIAVCAFMLLPAGAFLGGASAHPLSAGSAPSPLGATASTLNPAHPISTTSPASTASSPWNQASASSSSLTLSSAKSAQQYAKALDNVVASKPGLSDSSSLSALASDIASGKVSPSSVYLPNLNSLENGPQSSNNGIGVGYVSNPAPMGIGDFGLGTSPYAYNTSHFAGSLSLNSANATYPGAYYFITPPTATNGSYNSPYYFGVQLNTVTSNISIPGNNDTAFWTQNVFTMNGNYITFENNVWNFSNGALNPGSIYSGSGTFVPDVFYYDYGPSISFTFPVTVDLFNNVSVVNHRDQVTFGYRITDSGGSIQGIYDTVVFNNPYYPMNPAYTPAFQVSGKYTTPLGLGYDAELIFGGPGGGSNAVFNNISGTETLQYSNQSSGGWKSVPSAYDFGSDTGETAIGVAETWAPGGIVTLSAGPSLLYGLWGAQPSTAVASGSIELQGTLTTPNWGFVFVGDGGPYYNQSYVPTNSLGGFLTYLPPVNSVFPASGSYYVFYLADGYTYTYTPFVASLTGVSEVLTANPGQWAEPLYVNGNIQAQSAATVLTGWVSGPLIFKNLVVLNGLSSGFWAAMFFDHLNDWGFVSFNMFQATGVTLVINVTNMAQGDSDWNAVGQNNYFMDGPVFGSPATLIGIPPAVTYSLPQYGSLVAFYSDTHVQVYSQDAIGYFGGSKLDPTGYYSLNPAGGAIVAWNDPGVYVNGTVSVLGSYGAYIAGSPNAVVWDSIGALGANAVSLAGSNDAKLNTIVSEFSVSWHNDEGTVDQTAIAVYDVGSSGGSVQNLIAAYGAIGYYGAGSSSTAINNVLVEYKATNITTAGLPTLNTNGFAVGVFLTGTTHIVVTNTTVLFGDGIGVEAGPGALGTTITDTTTYGYFSQESLSVFLYGSDWTNITNTWMYDTYLGTIQAFAGNTTFTNTLYYDNYISGYGEYNNYTTYKWLNLTLTFDAGIEFGFSDNSLFLNTNSSVNAEWALELVDDSATTITNLAVYDDALGAIILGISPATTATNVYANDFGYGVACEDAQLVSISTVFANHNSRGVELFSSSNITVTGVTATNYSYGVYADPSTYLTVSMVSASYLSEGVYFYETSLSTVTGITANDLSVGVALEFGSIDSVTTVTAMGSSIGVYLYDTAFDTVSGVTATDTTVNTPWLDSGYWGAPIAAIDSEDNTALTITQVTATMYPAGLWDYYSEGLTVTAFNATGGFYGVILNGTFDSVFSGIGAYQDWQGLAVYQDATYNTITMSSFVDDTSYGVAIVYGEDNYIWGNNFIGDNGATGTYNPTHIQAFSDVYNYFYTWPDNEVMGTGNYWADWHTYGVNGYLAPYLVSGGVSDEFPIGPQETFVVSFSETGLTSGTMWSVTFNGVTQASSTAFDNFTATIGTYLYQVGNVAGYTVSPASGSVTVSGVPYNVPVTYTAVPVPTYAVTLSAGGLSTGTTWSATVNGVTQSTTGPSLTWYLASGAYTYKFNNVSGYNLASTGASGSVTVASAPTSLSASYSPVTTPSYVSTDTFNQWLAVAFAVAVIALVIALLALLLRRRHADQPAQGAQPWTPPAASGGSGAGGSGTWSEGPPAGGSPPS